MGWAIGFDSRFGQERDIGYGVPATCDHPGCGKEIDRGLGYVCGGDVYGGDEGCGLFFCGEHLVHHRVVVDELTMDEDWGPAVCDRCAKDEHHFPLTPDVHEWVLWKACHPSWKDWRKENPAWCWANVTLGFWLLRQYWAIWDAGCLIWDGGLRWKVKRQWARIWPK